MTAKLRDDCFVLDRDRIAHADALATLKTRIAPVAAREDVALADALGRIAAADLTAPRAIPAHTNAAVDGYAFAHASYMESGGVMPVKGRAAAGHALSHAVAAGAAVRIFTGAAMPDGTDTVAMQEDAQTQPSDGQPFVRIPDGLKAGANSRQAGEDVSQGGVVIRAGARIRPQYLAHAAATGHATIPCFARLKVAVVSTGDEVIAPGNPLAPGQVYDANAPMLRALVALAGAEVHNLGILPDRKSVVRDALKEAAATHNVILTSGGASQGEEDHVVKTLAAIGRRHLWQIAIKPGRPMAFGQIGNCAVVGLPGNPVAVFVCFLMYVRPMLAALGGADWPEPMRYQLPAAFSLAGKKPGRREFWRASLVIRDGETRVEKFPRDGSGLISGLTAADGLIEVAEDVTEITEGERIDFIPLDQFGIVRA